VAPVQATPFTAKSVGAGLVPEKVPLKAGATAPFVGTDPFQPSFVTVTSVLPAACVQMPFQPLPTRWPVVGKLNVSLQLVQGSPTFVSRTSAPNPLPPDQLVT
jgi:hypothetical protein